MYTYREEMIRTKDETRTTMDLIRNYRNWRRYRETVSELNRLSNRELTDLGIGRSEVPHVLDEASRASRSCAWRL